MKRVIVALPGNSFSEKFLISWSDTLMTLNKKGYQVGIVNGYSSFVPFSRMKTLGLDVRRGVKQKPFNSEVDYDVWVTVDSDIVYSPDQFIELIEETEKHPVISGTYRMADLKTLAFVKKWDTDFFKKNGHFEFASIEDLSKEEEYVSVEYTGMGFFACTREVLEKLEYPYFHSPLQEIELDDGVVARDMASEDVSFCKNIKAAGYDIVVKTSLRVGHEKNVVL